MPNSYLSIKRLLAVFDPEQDRKTCFVCGVGFTDGQKIYNRVYRMLDRSLGTPPQAPLEIFTHVGCGLTALGVAAIMERRVGVPAPVADPGFSVKRNPADELCAFCGVKGARFMFAAQQDVDRQAAKICNGCVRLFNSALDKFGPELPLGVAVKMVDAEPCCPDMDGNGGHVPGCTNGPNADPV